MEFDDVNIDMDDKCQDEWDTCYTYKTFCTVAWFKPYLKYCPTTCDTCPKSVCKDTSPSQIC